MFDKKNRDEYEREYGTYRQPRHFFRKGLGQAIPHIPGFRLRKKLYQMSGWNIHPQVSFIGLGCILDDTFPELITIEEGVTIALRAMLIAHDDVSRTVAPIRVCKGAYIGAGAIVLQGVGIGENAVVGAGAVVTRDVPANQVVVGVPAKVLESKV